MKKPVMPSNEQERINALRAINILDTAAEERFDRVTRLAKRVFNIGISLVSLIDTNRQWFKSKQGLNVSETPRDISFCGHAILGNELFYVENALKDPRFATNPLVLGSPNIRFYAGIPLKVSDDIRVGTLCLIDNNPRSFDQEDLALLVSLGALVEQKLLTSELDTYDTLTHLSNRDGFDLLECRVLSYCQNKDIPMSVVTCNIDKFNTINDIFGESEGEYLLGEFARLMKQCWDNAAILARTGGHEFTALLLHSAPDDVQALERKLMNTLQEYNRQGRRGYDIECRMTTKLLA